MLVLQVQRALAVLGLLPVNAYYNGTMDVQTHQAITKYWAALPKNSSTPKFPIAPRVFKAIVGAGKRPRWTF
jgi:hypothetical protein